LHSHTYRVTHAGTITETLAKDAVSFDRIYERPISITAHHLDSFHIDKEAIFCLFQYLSTTITKRDELQDNLSLLTIIEKNIEMNDDFADLMLTIYITVIDEKNLHERK
jgi:hypothetical protein